ncbi:MAG: hypothetical protein LBG97_01065 [Coriobacteriales bacterium]|jgi:hypothetical protein|nr:hypothetical protein [Coriobacteriales bacterium]
MIPAQHVPAIKSKASDNRAAALKLTELRCQGGRVVATLFFCREERALSKAQVSMLLKKYPTLKEHACQSGGTTTFGQSIRSRGGALLPHVVEHLAIDLLVTWRQNELWGEKCEAKSEGKSEGKREDESEGKSEGKREDESERKSEDESEFTGAIRSESKSEFAGQIRSENESEFGQKRHGVFSTKESGSSRFKRTPIAGATKWADENKMSMRVYIVCEQTDAAKQAITQAVDMVNELVHSV